MYGRSSLYRTGSFRVDNVGQNVLALIWNLCFSLFVLGVLIFTIIATTYEPEDPLFNAPRKITKFLTSESNATFTKDNTNVRTGEDFMPLHQPAFASFINLSDVDLGEIKVDANGNDVSEFDCRAETGKPIDCRDPEVFHLLMTAAIERFKDIHFYRFGKAVRGTNGSSCHMAWRFRPSEGKVTGFYKDYREFVIHRSENCSLSVVGIGEYHSGWNARKKKKNKKDGFEKNQGSSVVPVFGESVNDTLPVVESEESFRRGKYLFYSGGGDRCKSMDHYLWSFMCALGEAQYLKRTLVMDMSLCLSSIYTASSLDEEGRDFRFYFDFEHLKESASVLDQTQFWADWNKWHQKNRLGLYLVEDYRATSEKLARVRDALVMRKFGSVEPDNYWYRVCEGGTESVIQRPWHLIWKSKRLMDIVSTIATRLHWDFDSVHVVRGEKARDRDRWPNLASDTSPEVLVSTLQDKIDDGRHLYVASDEPDTTFFDPLKDRYTTHFLDDYRDLWDENSEWYSETTKLNNGVPVEFDGYMRASVDTEIFLRGKSRLRLSMILPRTARMVSIPAVRPVDDDYVEGALIMGLFLYCVALQNPLIFNGDKKSE